MKKEQKELRELIFNEIEYCNTSLYPYVCGWRKTPEGKQLLAKNLEDIILRTGCSVQAAIETLERTYNPNLIED